MYTHDHVYTCLCIPYAHISTWPLPLGPPSHAPAIPPLGHHGAEWSSPLATRCAHGVDACRASLSARPTPAAPAVSPGLFSVSESLFLPCT